MSDTIHVFTTIVNPCGFGGAAVTEQVAIRHTKINQVVSFGGHAVVVTGDDAYHVDLSFDEALAIIWPERQL